MRSVCPGFVAEATRIARLEDEEVRRSFDDRNDDVLTGVPRRGELSPRATRRIVEERYAMPHANRSTFRLNVSTTDE